MTPLASIPEANTTSQGKHAAVRRPRSRVVFIARQPGPQRISTRKQAFAERRRSNNEARPEPQRNPLPTGTSTPDNETSPSRTSKISESPSWSNMSSSKATGGRLSLRSSFDYDSFPQPPSNGVSDNNDRSNTVGVPQSDAPRPALKPPPALSQRKLLFPHPKGPSNIRRSLAEAASNIVSPSKHASVDAELVDAVSRAIAQQLRLVSSTKYPKREVSMPSSSSNGRNGPESGTSTQERALNRFTRDLEAYAERTTAKGKEVNVTCTDPPSTTTLQTVSALMPFRSELRAAGLAVTSKDQGRNQSREGRVDGGRRLVKRCKPPRVVEHVHPSQLDGNGGVSGPSQSTTEISFAASQDIDEFRYALIDEAPARKKKKRKNKKRVPRKKRPKHHCLPCFTKEDDMTTDPDWAHFRPPGSKPKDIQQPKVFTGTSRPIRDIQDQERQLGQPKLTSKLMGQVDSASQSPGYGMSQKAEEYTKPTLAKAAYELESRPNFITTGRRHSMTLPKINLHRENGTNYRRLPKAEGNGIATGYRNKPDKSIVQLYGKYQGPSQDNGLQKSQLRTDQKKRECRDCRDSDWLGKHPNDQVSSMGDQSSNLAKGQLSVPVPGNAEPKQPDKTQRTSRQRPTRGRRVRRRPASQYDPYHLGICCPSTRGIPARAIARPNIPKRSSSIRGSIDSAEVDFDDREISDRDVLRGLHVAASAACNEEVDAFVRNRTGLRVRRFLADLIVLETLTAARPGEGKNQHARRRRAEMRKLKQQVRRSREIVMTGGLI